MDVLIYPNPLLRRGGRDITAFDGELRATAEQLFATMYDQGGVGLAAPQVGLDLNLLVLNPTGDRKQADQQLALVNPRIVRSKGHEFGEEGCLSFPGIYGEVERSVKIAITCRDLDGAEREHEFEDFLARIVQHEMDHLRGVLFTDRMSSAEKLRVRPRLVELERRFQQASA